MICNRQLKLEISTLLLLFWARRKRLSQSLRLLRLMGWWKNE